MSTLANRADPDEMPHCGISSGSALYAQLDLQGQKYMI